MNKTELLNIQIEFETTEITIEEICDKYSIKPSQLKGYTKWKRRFVQEVKPSDIIVAPTTSPATPPIETNSKIQDDINIFKTKAVKYALEQIEDTKYLEIREFKDLVSIVSTVETSIAKNDDSVNTVNIMIQNIMNKYQDDC
jgi:hypothetical protein